MNRAALKNKPAEDAYFRTLKLWQDATARLDEYSEASLKFIWSQVEAAWKRIGYSVGDRPKTNEN